MHDDILVIPTLGSHRTDEVLSHTFTAQDILPHLQIKEGQTDAQLYWGATPQGHLSLRSSS